MAGLHALMLISGSGQDAEVLEYLRSGHINIDETDDDGDTALVYAASNGHATTVDLLLAHGANPNIDASVPLLPMIAVRALVGERSQPHVSKASWRQVLNSLLRSGANPARLYAGCFALTTPDGRGLIHRDHVGQYMHALDDLGLVHVSDDAMRSRLGMR